MIFKMPIQKEYIKIQKEQTYKSNNMQLYINATVINIVQFKAS